MERKTAPRALPGAYGARQPEVSGTVTGLEEEPYAVTDGDISQVEPYEAAGWNLSQAESHGAADRNMSQMESHEVAGRDMSQTESYGAEDQETAQAGSYRIANRDTDTLQAEAYGTAESGSEDGLCVKTFGGFSLVWRGKSLTGGLKSRESQFVYLMQLLLHHREEGVARDRLEEILFGDRDINNVHHAMQSVIYNAKKRLRKAGLPDVNYIYLKKGVFYWTEKIPVYEDAAAFDDLCRRLRNEEDAAKRLSLCLSACRLYAGEFLPNQGGMLWAAREARRYRGQFCSCVEEATRLLRAEGDYMQMEELGRYAAQVHPLADWETVTMEALTAQGRYEDAQKLYDDTAELYLREQGLKPPKRLLEMLRHLGGSHGAPVRGAG